MQKVCSNVCLLTMQSNFNSVFQLLISSQTKLILLLYSEKFFFSDNFVEITRKILGETGVPPPKTRKIRTPSWRLCRHFWVPFFRVLGGGIPVSHNIFRGIWKIIANYREPYRLGQLGRGRRPRGPIYTYLAQICCVNFAKQSLITARDNAWSLGVQTSLEQCLSERNIALGWLAFRRVQLSEMKSYKKLET